MAIDLLLINAPTKGIYGMVQKASSPQPPLGLAYIAAYAEKSGYTVAVMDCDAEGIGIDGFKACLNKWQPNAIGFSTTTPTITTVIEMAQIAKNWDKNVVIIAGGAHATAMPLDTLERSNIDIIVRGEGEETIIRILRSFKGACKLDDIAGISYKHGSRIISNPDADLIKDIDKLPFPARHLLPARKYSASYYLGSYGETYANIIATRGCPYQCTFCGQDIIFKHKVRIRSAESIIKEIQMVKDEYGIKLFSFEDSTFVAEPDLVRDICRQIVELKMGIRWGAMGRANLADESLYREMKKAGCILLCYGAESGNQEILDRSRKKVTLKEIKDAVSLAKRIGIPVNTSFILGLPGETKESMRQTIRFALELDADYSSFSLATPYPGTEFYTIAQEEGTDLSDWSRFRLARYQEPLYVPKDVTAEDLKAQYKLAYKKFYLRPSYIIRSLAKIKSVSDLKHKVEVSLGLAS